MFLPTIEELIFRISGARWAEAISKTPVVKYTIKKKENMQDIQCDIYYSGD